MREGWREGVSEGGREGGREGKRERERKREREGGGGRGERETERELWTTAYVAMGLQVRTASLAKTPGKWLGDEKTTGVPPLCACVCVRLRALALAGRRACAWYPHGPGFEPGPFPAARNLERAFPAFGH